MEICQPNSQVKGGKEKEKIKRWWNYLFFIWMHTCHSIQIHWIVWRQKKIFFLLIFSHLIYSTIFCCYYSLNLYILIIVLVYFNLDFFIVNIVVHDELRCPSNIENCIKNYIIDFIVCYLFYRCNSTSVPFGYIQ